jgi:hypothetical protein
MFTMSVLLLIFTFLLSILTYGAYQLVTVDIAGGMGC